MITVIAAERRGMLKVSVFHSVEGIIPECSALTQTMMDSLERVVRENEIVFHERRAFENKTQKRQRMSKD